MSFDPERLYHLAFSLAERSSDEADLRAAISRLYYACFLVTAGRCDRKGIWSLHQRDCHSSLIRELKRRKFFRLGEQLEELRMLRVHADYHCDYEPRSDWNADCSHCVVRRESPTSSASDEWTQAREIGIRAYGKARTI